MAVSTEADKLLTRRTQVFHDVLIELRRTEDLQSKIDGDGSPRQSKLMQELLREFKVMVHGREAIGFLTWTDLLSDRYIKALMTKADNNRELELIGLASVCIRWAEELRKRKEP